MNQYQLYTGFIRAQKVYGQASPHVQLIAKQLDVLAGEVIDYILANPTLATVHYLTQSSGVSNPILGNEYTGMYVDSVTAIPFLTSTSLIREGDNGGTIIVTISGATFEAAAGTASNWTVGVGTSGLTFASVTKNNSTQCTLTFTGTATLGDITIMAENAAITASVDSDIVTFSVLEKALDYATVLDIANRLAAVELLIGEEGGANDIIDRLIAAEGNINDLEAVTPEVGEVTLAVAEEGSIELDTGISLDFINKVKGDNGLTINLIDPGEDNVNEIVVAGTNKIDVTLAYGTGAITSTAADVKSAIQGNIGANAMVSVAITGTTTTPAVNGSVVLSGGIDGTPAAAGKVFIGDAKVAVAKAECTASNSDGWEFVTYDV